MYRFKWSAFCTDDIINKLFSALNIENGDITDEIRNLLIHLFENIGGHTFSVKKYNHNEKLKIAEGLIHDAVKRLIFMMQPTVVHPGYIFKPSNVDQIEKIAYNFDRIPVNSASTEELITLPRIGAVIAKRIVSERTAYGYYKSIEDLMNRVEGIGEQRVKEICNAIWFDSPSLRQNTTFSITGDYEKDIANAYENMSGQSKSKKIQNLLESLCTESNTPEHKIPLNYFDRDYLSTEPEGVVEAEWIGILNGSEYWRFLPELMNNAQSAIEVCMFHIAFPSEDHPTQNLLNALKNAHENGVQVRVLVDQDKKTDPYLSTVINTPAKMYLEKYGVQCKFDTTDRLLHSKYVIVDEKITVIGSHNWSAGSYFHFDDLSFVIASSELSIQLKGRFEQLWNEDT